MPEWPHWLWLVFAFILFAVSVGASVGSLYLSTRKVGDLDRQLYKYKVELEKEKLDYRQIVASKDSDYGGQLRELRNDTANRQIALTKIHADEIDRLNRQHADEL